MVVVRGKLQHDPFFLSCQISLELLPYYQVKLESLSNAANLALTCHSLGAPFGAKSEPANSPLGCRAVTDFSLVHLVQLKGIFWPTKGNFPPCAATLKGDGGSGGNFAPRCQIRIRLPLVFR